jgi:transcriptional regulator with GAF, ATPase, and Fis domain
VNCGALDRHLARSELFGHERGAFTGASEKCTGYFQKATGGSLFLDEIGELALDVQPVLLRALENGTVTPLGSRNECPVDVRVIAATNRSLEELVLQGRFREDLFYRIQVVRVDLPPLRARSSDISVIASALALERANATLPQSVLEALERHHWPGNVRELRNVVDAFLAVGNLELRQGMTSAESSLPPRSIDAALGDFVDLDATYAEQKEELLGRFCRLYLARLLSKTNGNQTEAARISGIERSYLCKLVAKLSVPT